MLPEQAVPELLKVLRAHRSQAAVSRMMGYQSNVLYSWEAGRRQPQAADVFRMVKLLGWQQEQQVVDVLRLNTTFQLDQATEIARLLAELVGHANVAELARHAGYSRWQVHRWIRGNTEPTMHQFLNLIDARTGIALDVVHSLVDPARLPSLEANWRRLVAHRQSARRLPWAQAVLLALELDKYIELPEHDDEWVAAVCGLSVGQVQEAIDWLSISGQVSWDGHRWTMGRGFLVGTRADTIAHSNLRRWASEQGLRVLGDEAAGSFRYNIFTISEADLDKLKSLQDQYFRDLRTIVAESAPNQRLVVTNFQIFELRRPTDEE